MRDPGLTTVEIPPNRLRDLFNAGGHLNDAVAGHLTCCYVRKGIPASADEPSGTTAYTFDCFERDGVHRFRAHCYVRDDGAGNASYGGRGMRHPDPKILVVGTIRYVLERVPLLGQADPSSPVPTDG